MQSWASPASHKELMLLKAPRALLSQKDQNDFPHYVLADPSTQWCLMAGKIQ